MKLINLSGHTFARLTVTHRGPDHVTPSGSATARWYCLCSCGQLALVRGDYLRSGKTRSCGCLQRELTAERLREESRKRVGILSPSWKGDDIGYSAAHVRAAARRGPASDHQCVDCGAVAREWSYVGGCPREKVTDGSDGLPSGLRYSPDPDRYVSRCKPCHSRFDMAAREVA